MKLVFCKKCTDVVRLFEDWRYCRCGATYGRYTDDLNAVYGDDAAVPLGFANPSLVEAVKNQPPSGMGERFTAFVIPEECDTFKRE